MDEVMIPANPNRTEAEASLAAMLAALVKQPTRPSRVAAVGAVPNRHKRTAVLTTQGLPSNMTPVAWGANPTDRLLMLTVTTELGNGAKDRQRIRMLLRE